MGLWNVVFEVHMPVLRVDGVLCAEECVMSIASRVGVSRAGGILSQQ